MSLSTATLSGAALCTGPTLATVLNQVQAMGPCAIENLTFNFTSYEGSGDDVAKYNPAAIGFIPLTGANPGFELTGMFSSTSSTHSYGYIDLLYTVSVTGGSFSVVGLMVMANNAVAAVTPPTTGSERDHSATNYDVKNILYSVPTSGAHDGVSIGQSGNQAVPFVSTLKFNSTFAGILSEAGFLTLGTSASNPRLDDSNNILGYGNGGTASASFTSADFRFVEMTVPEPGTFVLLTTVCTLLIVPIRRRWHRQAE